MISSAEGWTRDLKIDDIGISGSRRKPDTQIRAKDSILNQSKRVIAFDVGATHVNIRNKMNNA